MPETKHLHFPFCTTLAPPNGLFWGRSAYFYFLSTKTALFVDSSRFLQTLSIKTAIFMDSKRLCTESKGIWRGGQTVPGTESRRNLCQEVIQDIQITLKIEPGLLIVKPPTGLAPVEHIKSLLQINIQSLRNLHHNAKS